MSNNNKQKSCWWCLTMIITYAIIIFVFAIFIHVKVFAIESAMDEPSVTPCESPIVDTPMINIEEELAIAETEPVVPAVRYFDVPLSEDLQDHIFTVCESYGVDPVVVMAVIKKESMFKAGEIGDSGNSFGLMQIQPRWHGSRMDRLGVTDLLDPYQNVIVGIDILAELFGKGGSLEWVLMSYNGGYAHANKHIANGTVSDYVAIVTNYMNTIERK